MSSTSKPITLADFTASLKDLPEDSVKGVQASIEISIEKLQETNDYLNAEIPVTTDENDLRIYKEAIEENMKTIENQKARLQAVRQELSSRGAASAEEPEGIYL